MFKKLAANRAARTAATPGAADSSTDSTTGNSTGSEPGAGGPGTTNPGTTNPVPATRTAPDPAAEPLLDPAAEPDYFGTVPHYALSPLTVLGPAGEVRPGAGIRKFVNSLPRVGDTPNELGNLIPVATPDTITYPGCDYYEIGVRQYAQQLHEDLPATRLRGYQQLNHGTDDAGQNSVAPPARPYHLGPLIRAHRDRPVRVKYVNQLPTGLAGELFLPVDTTVPGAGIGPLGGTEHYPQNRTVVHLHGGSTPWISDGGPGQWFTPARQVTSYPRGASYAAVPDMPAPEAGTVTAFYPNQQSGRLMWYHDHSAGISRLTVYSGQLGLYLLDDPVERQLITEGVLPAEEIPLVIQDKTFVPDDPQLAAQDPTWDTIRWGGRGSLWFPHVYLPNQNPAQESGKNPSGRWDYGPWCRPAHPGPEHEPVHGPVPNPYHDPVRRPWEPPLAPGTPTPSAVPTAFMDTPLVNGCVYPNLRLRPAAYRFRILNACNDRSVNLQLYYAVSNGSMWRPDGSLRDAEAGEVPMVEAAGTPGFPPTWPTDGRDGGVPDPEARGPDWWQIGNEGGLLPQVAVLPNQPINYVYHRRDSTVLNVSDHTLLLAPGERADVVIDFSSVPPGSNLILYNDCPAPLPKFDPRNDYYTGAPDRVATGGAPSTPAGYGPNTRTLMQIRVVGAPAAPFDLARLRCRLPQAYGQSQPPPIVPEQEYDAAFGTSTPRNTYLLAQDETITFSPIGGTGPVTRPLRAKTIVTGFEPEYGRAVARLGTELPNPGPRAQGIIPLSYVDQPTEVLFPSDPASPVGSVGDGSQLWRITQHGSDTHAVHFRYFNVQLVNRVGWDGVIRAPERNELGWKETVRMNPGEDIIVAMRPTLPDPLPFKIGDSVRLSDPTRLAGNATGFTQVDPETGGPAVVTNRIANLGWEYAWHCHPFGQQDTGMARPMLLRCAPAAPTGLTAAAAPGSPTVLPAIVLTWTNNAIRPAAASIVIERAAAPDFGSGVTTIVISAASGSYADSAITPGVTYYYRVRTENSVSYSTWSNTAGAAVHLLPPTRLTATLPVSPPLRVALAWTNRSFVGTVDLQRATNPTFTSGLVTTAIPLGGTYTDRTVSANTTYYYRVHTGHLGVSSPWSNVATAVVPGIPAVPELLCATAEADGPGAAVNLTWTGAASSVVTGYELQRATSPTFTSGLATITIAGALHGYADTGLLPGISYHYRIRAYNAAGSSVFTDPVAATGPR